MDDIRSSLTVGEGFLSDTTQWKYIRKWPALMPEANGRTHHPTWPRLPPPTPPPYLSWRKHKFSSPGLSALATGPSFSISLHLTFPLFPVSFLIWKLSKIRALLLVTITLVSIYIFIFSFRLQKCQSLILVARYRLKRSSCLELDEKDCWPLYYSWRSIYLVTIKCFFFLVRARLEKLWETERGVRRGTDGMGWADHWDESFLLKNDERRMEVRGYLDVDLWSLMAI